jgi:hypothetical protein
MTPESRGETGTEQAPDAAEHYEFIQGLLRAGLVVVVGSGASCAYGLPGMSELADAVLNGVPPRLSELDTAPKENEWESIAESLSSGMGLEMALSRELETRALGDLIANIVGDVVSQAEGRAFIDMLTSGEVGALAKLFGHLLRVSNAIDVVTTNYDRLIELQAAMADISVDTMFHGHTLGRLDEHRSASELLDRRDVQVRGKRIQRTLQRPHVRLSKPHGSLDWYTHNGTHIRSDLPIPGRRRIIAPGGDKYRLGYELPYDAQRKRANEAISEATAFLFIGYGFNDEHLQTYLKTKFTHVPSLILSHTLTESALEYLGSNASAMGIDFDAQGGGSRILIGDTATTSHFGLWDINIMIEEVFGL